MRFEVPTATGPASVVLERPVRAQGLLVLTHGAAGGVDAPDLLAIRDAVTAAGIAVARVLQPYRVAGRRSPPRPGQQDDAWLEVVIALRRRRGLGRLPLVLGGRSNGARVACRTASRSGATAVLALAFPLHPPGRPDVSRLGELEAAGVPVLVVQGDRDRFGMPPAGPQREVVVVAGADHALRTAQPSSAAATMARASSWICARCSGPRNDSA